MPIKFGIFGCGMIGKIYADRICSLGHEVVSACDVDLARARALKPTQGAYGSHTELLAARGIDVACVCSPTPYHYRAVLDAADAGVDVFLEKPMGLNLHEALEMSAAMRSAGRKMGFGFKMRFETIFSEAKSLIAAGHIGRPRFATFSFYQPIPPGERIWYADVGVIRDMLVHMFDMATWMFSAEPIEVRARTLKEIGRAGEDKAFVDIRLVGCDEIRVQGGYIAGFPEIAGREDIVFQIVGEEGYIVGKRPDSLMSVTKVGLTHHPIVPVDPFQKELSAFISALESGGIIPVTDQDGLRAQKIIELADRSAASNGAPISWSDAI